MTWEMVEVDLGLAFPEKLKTSKTAVGPQCFDFLSYTQGGEEIFLRRLSGDRGKDVNNWVF